MLFGCGREPHEIGNLQLTPLESIQYFMQPEIPLWRFFINIICNIVVFVPFGFLGLAFPYLKKFLPITILFVAGIILIESTQYFTGRGTADVDDVLLNTLGMLTGFTFYKLIGDTFFETADYYFPRRVS